MKIRQFQNGCDYNSQSYPFFVCRKMLPICLRNAPYLSLSVEPIKFRFLSQKNAPYLSPCYYKSLSFMLLYQANSMGFEVKNPPYLSPTHIKTPNLSPKYSPNVSWTFPTCPRNAPNLSPKCSQSVPNALHPPYLSPRGAKCSLSVPQMSPKCPRNAPNLSPKCSQSVPVAIL